MPKIDCTQVRNTCKCKVLHSTEVAAVQFAQVKLVLYNTSWTCANCTTISLSQHGCSKSTCFCVVIAVAPLTQTIFLCQCLVFLHVSKAE